MTDREGLQRFLRFCVVGGIGFCTDAGLLQAGIHFFSLGPLTARIPSFLIAVLVTWYLNRAFTFRMPERSFRSSFPAYIAANSVGLALNVGVYAAGVLLSPALAQTPLIPLAAGAVLGLAFNFAASRWIFREK